MRYFDSKGSAAAKVCIAIVILLVLVVILLNVLNKEDNESLNDYLKRQKITDIKIVEYMKSIKYE